MSDTIDFTKRPVFPDPLSLNPPHTRRRGRVRNAAILRTDDGYTCATCGATHKHGPVTVKIKEIGSGFFDRHPGLLECKPTVYAVSTRNTKPFMRLGWFVADPRHMPLVESKGVYVMEKD